MLKWQQLLRCNRTYTVFSQHSLPLVTSSIIMHCNKDHRYFRFQQRSVGVTFGFSSARLALLSAGRYFRTPNYVCSRKEMSMIHWNVEENMIPFIALVFVNFGDVSLPFTLDTQPSRLPLIPPSVFSSLSSEL